MTYRGLGQVPGPPAPNTVSANLLRAYMDHVDVEMSALNEEMQAADRVRRPDGSRVISIVTMMKWNMFLRGWSLFYKDGRPADITVSDAHLWKLTGAYEDDLYEWRETYRQEMGAAPKSRYALFSDVLEKKEKPLTINIGPPHPFAAGVLTAIGATIYLAWVTRGGKALELGGALGR